MTELIFTRGMDMVVYYNNYTEFKYHNYVTSFQTKKYEGETVKIYESEKDHELNNFRIIFIETPDKYIITDVASHMAMALEYSNQIPRPIIKKMLNNISNKFDLQRANIHNYYRFCLTGIEEGTSSILTLKLLLKQKIYADQSFMYNLVQCKSISFDKKRELFEMIDFPTIGINVQHFNQLIITDIKMLMLLCSLYKKYGNDKYADNFTLMMELIVKLPTNDFDNELDNIIEIMKEYTFQLNLNDLLNILFQYEHPYYKLLRIFEKLNNYTNLKIDDTQLLILGKYITIRHITIYNVHTSQQIQTFNIFTNPVENYLTHDYSTNIGIAQYTNFVYFLVENVNIDLLFKSTKLINDNPMLCKLILNKSGNRYLEYTVPLDGNYLSVLKMMIAELVNDRDLIKSLQDRPYPGEEFIKMTEDLYGKLNTEEKINEFIAVYSETLRGFLTRRIQIE